MSHEISLRYCRRDSFFHRHWPPRVIVDYTRAGETVFSKMKNKKRWISSNEKNCSQQPIQVLKGRCLSGTSLAR
jgi:hypothetical protein